MEDIPQVRSGYQLAAEKFKPLRGRLRQRLYTAEAGSISGRQVADWRTSLERWMSGLGEGCEQLENAFVAFGALRRRLIQIMISIVQPEHAWGNTVTLALHPEAIEHRARVERLHAQLVRILEKQAELEHHVGPYLEALYRERFGRLELSLLQLQMQIAKQRRELELLRQVLNRGEALDQHKHSQIQQQLTEEMTEWKARLRQREHELRVSAQRLAAVPMTQTDVAHLKDLYRRLVRRLHPDMTNGETELYRLYWHEVQRAYEQGDIAHLESLTAVINSRSGEQTAEKAAGIADSNEIDHLTNLLKVQTDRLLAMRTEPPLCYEEQLNNWEWCQAKQAEIKQTIERQRETLAHITQVLEAILEMPEASATVH